MLDVPLMTIHSPNKQDLQESTNVGQMLNQQTGLLINAWATARSLTLIIDHSINSTAMSLDSFGFRLLIHHFAILYLLQLSHY